MAVPRRSAAAAWARAMPVRTAPCGPCRIVGPIVEELSKDLAGRLKVLKVNVDENQQTALRFDARSIRPSSS